MKTYVMPSTVDATGHHHRKENSLHLLNSELTSATAQRNLMSLERTSGLCVPLPGLLPPDFSAGSTSALIMS